MKYIIVLVIDSAHPSVALCSNVSMPEVVCCIISKSPLAMVVRGAICVSITTQKRAMRSFFMVILLI